MFDPEMQKIKATRMVAITEMTGSAITAMHQVTYKPKAENQRLLEHGKPLGGQNKAVWK